MIKARYIVIEGPIGVGKSSLSRLLAKRLKARLILEKADENPFLVRFYQDRRQYAFQTQLFFLLSRYRQLEGLRQEDLFQSLTLSDYFIPKDRLFAEVNLPPDELRLYDQIYRLLSPRVPRPDLVVYLQASTQVLWQRIRSRGRSYEKKIDWDYLDAVNRAYNEFFFYYDESPLLVVETSEIDFVKHRQDLDDLIRQIGAVRSGVQYYVPQPWSSDRPGG